jgi:mannitol/fructose-specific phosphotransferase system IIA component (Ntr-type)
MLSRISRLMNRDELREKLTKAKSVAEVRKLFKDSEQDMFDL